MSLFSQGFITLIGSVLMGLGFYFFEKNLDLSMKIKIYGIVFIGIILGLCLIIKN